MRKRAANIGSQPRQAPSGTASLRSRLIVANSLITALAIAAIGYFIYYRGQQSNAYLAGQLEDSVRQQAADKLATVSNEQASTLNLYFAGLQKDMTEAGSSAGTLLSQEAGLSSGSYWDATKSMYRLANGSWDSVARTDPASVFMPANLELSDALAVELNMLKHLDFVVPGKLQANPDVVAMYFGGVSGETVYYPNIDLATIVPPDFDVTQRPWFVKAAPSQNPQHQAVWAAPYLDAALHGLVVTTSIPVFDASGAFRGVIAMDVQLGRISDLISSIHVGASGYAFLIDRDKHLIALPEAGYRDLGVTAAALPLGEVMDSPKAAGVLPAGLVTILGKMSAGQGGGGLETVSIGGVDRFVIYRPVPEVGYSMALVVPSQELLAGSITAREQLAALSANTTRISLLLVGLILFLAIMASVWLSNTLTAPLAALTHAAQEISGGNLGAHISVQSRDEIGILSQTLNTMTRNLSDMIQSLERRVRDRTADLQVATEQANRRASQFEAITRVTSAISATRNVDELMPLVTTAISEQFGYYHVGVFLNDEASQNVYLIAANSEGGRKMLDRYHSLKIGEQGIVGFVAARGEPRVARNVGEDVVFFNNPDLPGTRSEAALPLRSGGQTIGVLDVQSTKEDAFTPDDLGILAVLADQVSLAIENTRLLETTQRSLVESETLYRQYVRGAWSRLQAEEQVEGYRYSPRGSVPVGRVRGEALTAGANGQSLASSNPPLKIPVSLRGQAIGELVVEGPPDQPWNQDQVDLVQAVADRVALSVENARLFGETDRRAERERLVAEIASKIRSTNDPQEMMQTALNELRSALGASQVEIITQAVPSRLGDEEQEPPPSAASADQQPRPGSGANR